MIARPFVNRIDPLEPRLLLASFATLDSTGRVHVVGDAKSNTIAIVYSGSKVKVTRDGSSLSFDKTKVNKILVEAAGGNDKVTVGVPLPSTLIGSDGNDTLISNAGDDLLEGGAGNDVLKGGAGKDALHGNDGNDDLDGGKGDDYLDGGAGSDTADYSSRTTEVFAEILLRQPNTYIATGSSYIPTGSNSADAEVDKFYEMETLLGGSGDDALTLFGGNFPVGSPRGFKLIGNGGNDLLRVGYDPPDVDGRSHVTVGGGAGDDTIQVVGDPIVQAWGDSGNDSLQLVGSASTTHLTADLGSGTDTTGFAVEPNTGIGHLTLPPGCENFGGFGNMVVIGNELNNTMRIWDQPGNAVAQVFGMGGNDNITGGSDAHHVLIADGGAGNDTIHGSPANDTLAGGSGNDLIEAVDGNDIVFGDSDNDTLLGQKGNDQIHGGTGDDSIWGGTGNDTLWGDAGHDRLFGEDGNDMIYAKDGQTDTLDGGSGTDTAQRDNTSTIKDVVLNIESFI